ncbi:PLDc N-terminal domain-containing protein [Saccharophagus degradans]|uniref:PLDc N-terminal domain-containing protein n=1 Tax=Saccharophagus degradans TaxID=86304 RepID=UPI001C09A542|nr:PLDc N-terminal domain-containing protein [Saccharophagus degradans]MBU2985651.1 PLDc N-terminal domain-containing protein [Saccharophagus degradans]
MLETGIGILIFALIVWAVLKITASNESTEKKVLWILFILVVPVIGLICWVIFGPKGSRARL